MKNAVRKVHKKLPFWFVGLILTLVGIILLFSSNTIEDEFYSTFLTQLASVIMISGIFSLINTMFLNQSITTEVLEKFNLSESINRTGLKEINTLYNEIPFKKYFEKKLDEIIIIHSYGLTWTNNYEDYIKRQVSENNCKITVIILSENSGFAKPLAEHYNTDLRGLKNKINEVVESWKSINKLSKNNNISLYKSKSLPSYSLYKFDNDIISIYNPLSKDKTKSLNSILITKNNEEKSMYNSFMEDVEKLISQSENINLGS